MKQFQTPSIKARRSNIGRGTNLLFGGFLSECLSLHKATPNTLYKSPAFEHDRVATCFPGGFFTGCLSLHQATPNTLYKSPAFEHYRVATCFSGVSFLGVCLCMKQLQTPSIKARRSNMIGGQVAFPVFFSGCLSLHEATPNTLYKSPAFEHDRGTKSLFGAFVSGCLSLHEATPNTLYKSPAFEHYRVAICFSVVSSQGVCLCMKQFQTPSIKARRSNMIG